MILRVSWNSIRRASHHFSMILATLIRPRRRYAYNAQIRGIKSEPINITRMFNGIPILR